LKNRNFGKNCKKNAYYNSLLPRQTILNYRMRSITCYCSHATTSCRLHQTKLSFVGFHLRLTAIGWLALVGCQWLSSTYVKWFIILFLISDVGVLWTPFLTDPLVLVDLRLRDNQDGLTVAILLMLSALFNFINFFLQFTVLFTLFLIIIYNYFFK